MLSGPVEKRLKSRGGMVVQLGEALMTELRA